MIETKQIGKDDLAASNQGEVELSPATKLRLLDEWEKDAEIKDKYTLMALMLKRKAAW